MKQEYEMPSSPVAIPYKWEAAPGTPIAEVVPAAPAKREPWISPSPLRPPPGARRGPKPLQPSFDGFEPRPPVVPETQLVERILKKLNRLRRKSMVAAACFTSEAQRVIEHSGMLFPPEDLDGYSYDSDAMSSVSTIEHPGTPYSSTSYESAHSEPSYSRRNTGTIFSSSPYLTRTPPSTRRYEEDGEDCFDHSDAALDDDKILPGPRESAWHVQFSSELRPPPIPEKLHIRRSYSALIPTILRQSSSSRSLKQLSLGRPFRKSKATKQLDLGKM